MFLCLRLVLNCILGKLFFCKVIVFWINDLSFVIECCGFGMWVNFENLLMIWCKLLVCWIIIVVICLSVLEFLFMWDENLCLICLVDSWIGVSGFLILCVICCVILFYVVVCCVDIRLVILLKVIIYFLWVLVVLWCVDMCISRVFCCLFCISCNCFWIILCCLFCRCLKRVVNFGMLLLICSFSWWLDIFSRWCVDWFINVICFMVLRLIIFDVIDDRIELNRWWCFLIWFVLLRSFLCCFLSLVVMLLKLCFNCVILLLLWFI